MSRHHYVYVLKDTASSRFYIGKRSSARPPQQDKYSGSGTWPTRCRAAGKVLKKIIIRAVDSDAAAFELERRLVQRAKSLHPKRCMNLTDGGLGLTSDCARRAWENSPPERRTKAAARAVEVSRRLNLPARMTASTTFEERSAWGRKAGSAGKGVPRNSGDANPMRIKASESKDLKTVRIVETGEIVTGNWHQLKQRFGKIHCGRLLAGRVSRGLILERTNA